MDLTLLPFVLFVLLQVVDFATSVYAIKLGASELNVVIKWGMDRIGLVPAMAFFKLLAVAAIGWLLINHPIVLSIIDALYVGIAINNILVIRKLKNA